LKKIPLELCKEFKYLGTTGILREGLLWDGYDVA